MVLQTTTMSYFFFVQVTFNKHKLMNRKRWFRYLLLYIFCLMIMQFGHGQGGINLGITGHINTMFSIYDFQSTDPLMMPRQNKFGWNLNGSINLSINDKFSIPFSFSIMNNQINAYYPIPNLKFFERITHPSSIISFSPTFKWGTIYLGSHVPQVSTLIAGEVQIFGGGFDLNPGIVRIATSYGYAETDIQPDTLNSIRGSYRRHYNTIKVGIGKKDKSGIYLNFVKFSDDAASISLPAKILPPQEGIGVSSNIDVKFSNKLKFSIDGGGSIYTDDQFSALADSSEVARIASFVIKPRKSSSIDLAGISSFSYNSGNFGLGVNAQYIGAGFRTPGFPNRPSDVLDLTVNTRFSIFKSKINFNGITGIRQDNLSQTKITSNNSLLINAAINMMLAKFLTINTSYSNFGIERKEVNDSINISTISSNIVLTPSVNFKTGTVSHLLNLSYNFNQSENLNLFTGVNNNNIITTYNLMYNVRVNTFNCSVSGFMAENNQNGIDILIKSLNILPSITVLDKKLKIGVGFNYSNSLIGGEREDTRKTLSLRTGYDFQNGIVVNMNGNLTSFDSDRGTARSGFDESRVQMNVNYTLGKSKSKEKTTTKQKDEKKNTQQSSVPSDKDVVPADNNTNKEQNRTPESKIAEIPKNADNQIKKADSPQNDTLTTKKDIAVPQKMEASPQEPKTKEIPSKSISKDTSTKTTVAEVVKENIARKDRIKAIDITTINTKDIPDKTEIVKILPDSVMVKANQVVPKSEPKKDAPIIIKEPSQINDSSFIVKKPDANQKTNVAHSNDTKDDIRYYIQLVATKSKVDVAKIYKQFANNIELKTENGLNKYMIPCGTTYESAIEHMATLNAQGLKEGFIVKYKNNNRVKINN